MKLTFKAGYFVFIKINMKTPEKKSSEFPSGPRSYFTNFPKFDINKINTSMCKRRSNLGKRNFSHKF